MPVVAYIECYLCKETFGKTMEIHLLLLSMAVTLLAAALTVPAGFGLATMLTPVVLFWLPPHEAIAVSGTTARHIMLGN